MGCSSAISMQSDRNSTTEKSEYRSQACKHPTAVPRSIPWLPAARVRRHAAVNAPRLSLQPCLQSLHKRDQVAFLLRGQLEPQDQIKELDRVFQRQAPAGMEIRRTVFNPPQGKGFHRPQRGFVDKALHAQVMHQVVKVKGRDVARGTLPLAEKHRFAAPFTLRRSRGI